MTAAPSARKVAVAVEATEMQCGQHCPWKHNPPVRGDGHWCRLYQTRLTPDSLSSLQLRLKSCIVAEKEARNGKS